MNTQTYLLILFQWKIFMNSYVECDTIFFIKNLNLECHCFCSCIHFSLKLRLSELKQRNLYSKFCCLFLEKLLSFDSFKLITRNIFRESILLRGIFPFGSPCLAIANSRSKGLILTSAFRTIWDVLVSVFLLVHLYHHKRDSNQKIKPPEIDLISHSTSYIFIYYTHKSSIITFITLWPSPYFSSCQNLLLIEKLAICLLSPFLAAFSTEFSMKHLHLSEGHLLKGQKQFPIL